MKARLPGGFGGKSMNNMLKQAQKIQAQMTQIQEDLTKEEFQGSSGGGAVCVTVTGDKMVKSVKISPEVVSSDETEMLEDLIVAAFNQAMKNLETESGKRMGAVTGDISIPGLI